MSHTDFARTLTVPDSEDEHGRPEPYAPRSHPGQWHFLQAVDGIVNNEPAPRRWRRFLLLADAQGGGKTWLLQQLVLHGTIELGQAVIWALPTKGMAGDLWTLKLRPAWEGSGLGVYLPTSGPGSRGSAAPRTIKTRRCDRRGGGPLAFMSAGGRGQAGQAGLTAKRLIVDELGDWSKAAFTRIRKRVSRFNDIAVEAYASTLKLDAGDLTLSTYDDGTRAYIEYHCIHCHDWTPFVWSTWNAAIPAIACTACRHSITEVDRKAMLGAHRLAMSHPLQEIFSLRLTALDCPWKPLGWLAAEAASAEAAINPPPGQVANHEPMRTFFHDERDEPYTGDQQEEGGRVTLHDNRSLAERSRMTAWCVDPIKDKDDQGLFSRTIAQPPPIAVAKWVCAIDVQRNRVYWCLIAITTDKRSWDVAWGYESARAGAQHEEPPPWSPGDLRSVLSRVADLVPDYAGRQIDRGVVDVSDGVTIDEVLEFLSSHAQWRAIQGEAGELPKARPGSGITHLTPVIAYSNRWKQGRGSYHIITDLAQQAVAEAYLIQHEKPGAALMPGPLKSNDVYILHITGTTWVVGKANVRTWKKIRERNDYLDTRAYATAVGFALLATDPASDGQDDDATHSPPKPRPRAPSFLAPFQ